MSSWSVEDAKARFSELLDACISGGPQIVTKRGVKVAVHVPIAAWRRLQERARPSIKTLLLADEGRTDTLVRPRSAPRRRAGRAVE